MTFFQGGVQGVLSLRAQGVSGGWILGAKKCAILIKFSNLALFRPKLH